MTIVGINNSIKSDTLIFGNPVPVKGEIFLLFYKLPLATSFNLKQGFQKYIYNALNAVILPNL
jgi:hypothetical protein